MLLEQLGGESLSIPAQNGAANKRADRRPAGAPV